LPALCGEDDRASVLASYGFDELHGDDELARIVRYAAMLCEAPIATVSLVERERQRFLASDGLDIAETPRSTSFCAHAMLRGALMEVRDATRDPRFADNPLVTGGESIRFYAGAPLITPEGAPLGALCVIDRVPRPEGLSEVQREGLAVLGEAVMRRLGVRRQSLAASQEASASARRLRELADWLPVTIWSADEQGNFDYFNRRWEEVTGKPWPRSLDDWVDVVHQEDRAATGAEWRRCFAEGTPFEGEFRVRQSDGSWRWSLSRALPFRGPDGAVSRWYGTLTDIDSGHRLSQNRDLLARELSHRIKNIFAVVAGLISIRARKQPEARAFADEVIGAIRALGRAHDFVRPVEGVKGESLGALLGELLAPYVGDDGDKLSIEGGDCKIGPRAATPLALVFHELATNSAKYGAFSADEGRVAIKLDCPDEEGIARIEWREHDGPDVSDAFAEGFGSRLIQMAIEGQLGGKVERRFASNGLEVDLEMKASAIRN
jgi:PAS domain S-box-containing protein